MDAWRSLAPAFGLAFVRVPAAVLAGAGFAALRRATEPPPIDAPASSWWMAGERDGLGVVVREDVFDRVAKTSVAVEIAPPMFVGMRMQSPGCGRFLVPHGTPADHHGFGDLAVFAHDAPRAHLYLDPRMGSKNLLSALELLKSAGQVAVQDGLVEVLLSDAVTDETRLAIAIDAAVAVARAFSERGRLLPPGAADQDLRDEWESFAPEHGLTLDWTRRRMSGGALEIGFEPLPLGALTTVRVKLRRVLAAGLHLRRDPRGRFVAKKSPKPDSVQVGDGDFDAQFVIDALAPERARAALSDASLRPLLADLGAASTELVMNDREIFSSFTGRLPAADLWSRAQALDRAASLVTPERAVGPYR
jgi:hypothetical protein